MPYYIHIKTQTEPAQIASGVNCRYSTAAHAYTCLLAYYSDKTHKVTYVETAAEVKTWQERETARFDDGTYIQVPWAGRMPGDTGLLHYPHLSLKSPGLVAYTKTPEHGYLDRQTSIRPGKYLQEFYPDLAGDTRDKWIAACSTDLTLSLATSESDIRNVYMNGPSSCMDGQHWNDGEMNSDIHPSAVYADSDLAVAYFGTLTAPKARCIVWPDKKYYSRLYGDEARLRLLLENAGYTKHCLSGARVRAIPTDTRGRYLMPYVDYLENGRVSADGKWITIGDSGDIDIQTCNGISGFKCADDDCDDDDAFTCSHCDNRCADSDYGGDGECDSCYNDRVTCHDCDHTSHDIDDFTEVGSDWCCESCTENHTSICEVESCGDTWIEANLSWTVGLSRVGNVGGRICVTCAETHTVCHACDAIHEKDSDTVMCPECSVSARCTDTMDLLDSSRLASAVHMPCDDTDYYQQETTSVPVPEMVSA